MRLEQEFVTHEIAIKLKELGFNEKCLYSIEHSEGGRTLQLNPNLKNNSECYIGEVALPFWRQAIRFLRTEKRIFISVNSWTDHGYVSYGYEIYRGDSSIILKSPGDGYKSEEEALEKAIKKAFKILEDPGTLWRDVKEEE